jgi:hypothetical protein
MNNKERITEVKMIADTSSRSGAEELISDLAEDFETRRLYPFTAGIINESKSFGSAWAVRSYLRSATDLQVFALQKGMNDVDGRDVASTRRFQDAMSEIDRVRAERERPLTKEEQRVIDERTRRRG